MYRHMQCWRAPSVTPAVAPATRASAAATGTATGVAAATRAPSRRLVYGHVHPLALLLIESPIADGLPDGTHETVHVVDIVYGHQRAPERLLGLEQVMQVPSREVATRVAPARLVDGPRVQAEPGLWYVHVLAEVPRVRVLLLPIVRHDQGAAMPSEARGVHTVKGVDAVAHAVEDVGDAPDAKEVDGAVGAAVLRSGGHDIVHHALVRPQRPPNGRAKERLPIRELDAFHAEVGVRAALNDAVQRLCAVVAPHELVQGPDGPSVRASRGLRGVLLVHVEWRALVEHEDQVCPQLLLDVNGPLRGQQLPASVVVRPELGPVLVDTLH
mmetsp:Transcript_82566/g.138089  ORF Transcript_82566/g.138089 Transcript_82566/m.138089 type:complete len:327 (-) Transcript_82566:138-1118(-)|eukprot:CAMPEP_0174361364 /NCGR_PEP_ID=MMETSP0811_2-20130205/58894_1 /TAXON_ID=73025 ORGANISM="Eutreptiella gymnastica-like, Strain CCMP1594" /NCGR_SAMPLE_ID=MMETSP0811_2 /ASSEMBLY_ACC=CAM_ASM_000667 /LENGTH=326 /DNA_ID=CAMNT_0015497947 /DNA_START=358 /DNA_END=1338 /DNA_ORIENTATION=+